MSQFHFTVGIGVAVRMAVIQRARQPIQAQTNHVLLGEQEQEQLPEGLVQELLGHENLPQVRVHYLLFFADAADLRVYLLAFYQWRGILEIMGNFVG
jgi:hypothetical protein